MTKIRSNTPLSNLISDESFTKSYSVLTTKELAKLLGVSRKTIWKTAKRLGLSKEATKANCRTGAIQAKLLFHETLNTAPTDQNPTTYITPAQFKAVYRVLGASKMATLYKVSRQTIWRKCNFLKKLEKSS